MSTLLMMILSAGAIFFVIQTDVLSADGGNDYENGTLAYTFSDETYFFHLSRESIRDTIEEATSTVESIEGYLLEETMSTLTQPDIAFVYVETPRLTAIKETKLIYDHFGRTPSVPEMEAKLSDQFLPIHVRFTSNRGFVYEVVLYQGAEKVSSIKREVTGAGAMQTVYVDTSGIDFSQPATVVVEDQMDEALFVEYAVDFGSLNRK
ncbi:hypothetical protein FLK61_36370 [Paenalkalicoccus suaedae]|uniref:Uncharacterized protein n=2 Tax=Paenalkalicoccus suaedae TaxID=2592382 RepID=A0A859FGB7_9BACI|nr:hypothetical protein FLK61_36370 [Paenalkalicoccus suaedae]